MIIVIWLFFLTQQYYFKISLAPMAMWTNLLLAALFIISSSFLGVLVSILVPSQLKATEMLMVIATPSFVFSGFTWPLSQMPLWIQYLADVIPLTHFLKGYRILLMQNGNLSAIQGPLIGLAFITTIYGLMSYIALRWKMKRALKSSI